jgi:hypothetical protein
MVFGGWLADSLLKNRARLGGYPALTRRADRAQVDTPPWRDTRFDDLPELVRQYAP